MPYLGETAPLPFAITLFSATHHVRKREKKKRGGALRHHRHSLPRTCLWNYHLGKKGKKGKRPSRAAGNILSSISKSSEGNKEEGKKKKGEGTLPVSCSRFTTTATGSRREKGKKKKRRFQKKRGEKETRGFLITGEKEKGKEKRGRKGINAISLFCREARREEKKENQLQKKKRRVGSLSLFYFFLRGERHEKKKKDVEEKGKIWIISLRVGDAICPESRFRPEKNEKKKKKGVSLEISRDVLVGRLMTKKTSKKKRGKERVTPQSANYAFSLPFDFRVGEGGKRTGERGGGMLPS